RTQATFRKLGAEVRPPWRRSPSTASHLAAYLHVRAPPGGHAGQTTVGRALLGPRRPLFAHRLVDDLSQPGAEALAAEALRARAARRRVDAQRVEARHRRRQR